MGSETLSLNKGENSELTRSGESKINPICGKWIRKTVSADYLYKLAC